MRSNLLKVATTTIFRLNHLHSATNYGKSFIYHKRNKRRFVTATTVVTNSTTIKLRGGEIQSILSNSNHIQTQMDDEAKGKNADIWSIDDNPDFGSLSHVGYSLSPDPVDHVGGEFNYSSY